MATLGLILVVSNLLICAFIPINWHPLVYGVFGGLGSSLISAQVDAVVFETYYSHLGLIRGVCFTGQAIGQAIFPHILTALIDQYSYQFSYIVLSGIMLQTLPAILLLKVEESDTRPMSFSRYSDVSKAYSLFNNGESHYYSTELQLHDMGKKSWRSPSDDNLHCEEDFINEIYEEDANVTITPPPSPEEKRRNIFGVEILPEIPEESEESDENEDEQNDAKMKNNKKRLSVAIKRLSTMGDNFSEYIMKHTRRDPQSNLSESREYEEIEVAYDNISPVTEIQRERVLDSFSYRCQSAFASIRRRMWMPSYRVHRIKRRMTYVKYSLNDTFVKPLSRSLSCWRFYPSLLLCWSKLSITAISLALLPMIATQMHPKISLIEANFLITLHGFTWICFLLCTPWLAQTVKRNFKYVAVVGLIMSTAACFMIAEARDHDVFAIGCVVSGIGYGAISSCWETAVQDFVGVRKWPKVHSALETLSASFLAVFVCGLSILIKYGYDFQYAMFVLGILLAVVTLVWTIIAILSIYITNSKSFSFDIRRRF
ncbi:uncharacterized protein LOC113235171 isoform X2 [Hyposmocoma kahamanoa]|nr:uncharacterized protein LOC113235171 isoform X2 [Hyposmocoma kahamanoa]